MFPKSMRSIGGLYLRKLSRRRLNPRTAIQRSRARFELPRMFCLDSLRTAIHCFVCQLFVALVVTIGGPGFAQNAGSPAASASEAFRLRVQNTLHGGVEVSTNGGAEWLLLARVIRPVSASSAGAGSE